MSLPFKSLDAATATGAGSVHGNEDTKVDHSLKVSTTGGPSFTVALEGSLDGVVWTELGYTNNTSLLVTGDYPVRYVRANLGALTGGSSPTVTAWVASV